MRVEYECRNSVLAIKGYYDSSVGDCLCFYNCKGDDIKSRMPINPYNRTKQHRMHKGFEEVKDRILGNYNNIKKLVKENSENENVEIDYRHWKLIINKKVNVDESGI